jgi:hypothetical protein
LVLNKVLGPVFLNGKAESIDPFSGALSRDCEIGISRELQDSVVLLLKGVVNVPGTGFVNRIGDVLAEIPNWCITQDVKLLPHFGLSKIVHKWLCVKAFW